MFDQLAVGLLVNWMILQMIIISIIDLWYLLFLSFLNTHVYVPGNFGMFCNAIKLSTRCIGFFKDSKFLDKQRKFVTEHNI